VEAILRHVIRRTAKALVAYDEEFEDDAWPCSRPPRWTGASGLSRDARAQRN